MSDNSSSDRPHFADASAGRMRLDYSTCERSAIGRCLESAFDSEGDSDSNDEMSEQFGELLSKLN